MKSTSTSTRTSLELERIFGIKLAASPTSDTSAGAGTNSGTDSSGGFGLKTTPLVPKPAENTTFGLKTTPLVPKPAENTTFGVKTGPLVPAPAPASGAGLKPAGMPARFANNELMSQHPPGMYSQLSDGSYVGRADIPDQSNGGYRVVPLDYGVKQVDTSNQPQPAPAPAPAPAPPPAPTQPAPAPAPAQTSAPSAPAQQAAPTQQAAPVSSLPPLPEGTPPEQRKQFEDAHAQVANMAPEKQEPLKQALADPKSEAATSLVSNGAQIATDPASHPEDPPPQNMNDFGAWTSKKLEEYQALPFPAQLAIGAGLGLGVVGLISSLMGEGGMGSFLMAALGLGTAGAVGAGSGMFGAGAQNTTADMISSLGQATGMMPKELTPDQRAILTAKDPLAAAMQSQGNLSRDEAAKKVQEARASLEQMQRMQAFGGMQGRMFENMGLSPEEAAQAAQNAGALSGAYSDPNSALSKHLQQGEWYGDKDRSGWAGWAAEQIGPERLRNIQQGLSAGAQALGDWWNGGKTGSAHMAMNTNLNLNLNMNIAQQIYLQHEMMKAARCWSGYEPVPGKAPYSEDSCRPAGSKKKKPVEKKSAEELAAGKASVPEHEANEPTKQVKPKKTQTSHEEKVITGDLGQKNQKKSA